MPSPGGVNLDIAARAAKAIGGVEFLQNDARVQTGEEVATSDALRQ